MLYVEVVQAVLLYGLETWVMYPHIGRILGSFHHRVARRLMGRQPWMGLEGRCMYTPLAKMMTEAGLQDMETYLSRQQNTVAQYIATRPIVELRLAAEICPGTRVSKQWWENEGLEFVGVEGCCLQP